MGLGASQEPAPSLSDGNVSSPSPATVIEKKMDPPAQPDSAKEVEDRQPEENVSRLHETVAEVPKPVFRGFPSDDDSAGPDDL